eukprot:m.4395 g.4395  ORF g.4395 m.4395 type:complete len:125 (+) comp2974_c0_seq1:25-399(+)
MAYNEVGAAFTTHYYQTFAADRNQLVKLYNDTTFLSYEGNAMQGQQAIMQHMVEGLRFERVAHSLTAQDYHPMQDGGILIQVMGQLKADEDPPHGFCETFIIRQDPAGNYYVANQIFRLVIHNA